MPGENPVAGAALAGRPAGEDARRTSACTSHTPVAVERAAKLDANWFRRHPARAHRVRRLINGEGLTGPEQSRGPAGWSVFVVVKQVVPGIRLRLAFRGSRSPCSCEACAANLWRQAAPDRFKSAAVEIATIALGTRP
jgi:hypothetical protein